MEGRPLARWPTSFESPNREETLEVEALSSLLRELAEQARSSLAAVTDRGAAGERPGQYALDLVVDGPLVDRLVDAGLGVLSEEAGEVELERELVAVVDPVDGSTNASLGLPWYALSVCVVDTDGPLHALVVNLATGRTYEARRGGGATLDGIPLSPPEPPPLAEAIVAVNGRPPASRPFAQFRSLGASALDQTALASGELHAYVDFDEEAHGVWDYLGALLVCAEVGVEMRDAFGRELVVLDHAARRTPVATADPEAMDVLIDLRRS